MKQKKIDITIKSRQSDYSADALEKLFNSEGGEAKSEEDGIEIFTTGILRERDGRIELSYAESELTGMEGSTTSVSFDKNAPGLVSVLRDGKYCTALVFEEGKRHICTYDTPYMPIEICVVTQKLVNKIGESGGSLELDYLIETNGIKNERTVLSINASAES